MVGRLAGWDDVGMATASPSFRFARRARPNRLWAAAALLSGVLVLVLIALALAEWRGWPWLALPLQQRLSQQLSRQVSLVAPTGPAFSLHLLGGITLQTSRLLIAAPAWSDAPHLLQAEAVRLDLRYTDLWRAWRGGALRIEGLYASTLDARLERLADGRTSWQLGKDSSTLPASEPPPLPTFGHLQVRQGQVGYHDALLALDLSARLSLLQPAVAAGMVPTGMAAAPATALQVDATGRYHKLPVTLTLTSAGTLPSTAVDADAQPVDAPPLPLVLQAQVGRAALRFQGTVVDALHLRGLAGHFVLSGPSLAAVGDPVRVTLPTTAAFRAEGMLLRQQRDWQVRLDSMTIGGSRLSGAFLYTPGAPKPLLSGRLSGTRLGLADLGPAVGVGAQKVAAPGKVLPARPFDLAALRVMDANVLINIAEVDLNTPRLEPLRPMRGHLQLTGGVLTLTQLDANTAQGRLQGDLALDGRGDQALWTADLRWSGVRLEQWIHQSRRAANAPPYVSGRLSGHAALAGQGRSTAEILASLKGRAFTTLHGGAVSHLAIEGAGLDLAQALGVLMVGDDALPVTCAAADLVAERGRFVPRVMVLDTRDSTVWMDGSLSLADEVLDLRAVVSPKDASPLTLRTPLRVRGTFAAPKLSVDAAPLGRKLGASLLLSLLNPLAALLPLIDLGEDDAQRPALAQCRALLQTQQTHPPGKSAPQRALRNTGPAA